jgi:simple sugar transport system permease protein
VVGANEHAARYAGIDPRWIAALLLALSGALAGLAGAVEISGVYGRLQEGFAPGFGIAAIAVALVARLNPLLVPLSAFLFSSRYCSAVYAAMMRCNYILSGTGRAAGKDRAWRHL